MELSLAAASLVALVALTPFAPLESPGAIVAGNECIGDEEPSAEARKILKGLKDAGYAGRIAGYERIAALNAALVVPDAAVTRSLAEGLVDDALYVRERCLPLMLQKQDPGATIKGLLACLDQFDSDWKGIDKRIAIVAKNAGGGDKKHDGFGENDQRNLQASMLHGRSLFRALGEVPDPRVEKALCGFLGTSVNEMPGFLYLCAVNGCVGFRSKKSIGAVADFTGDLAKGLENEKIKKRIVRGRPWVGYGQLEVYGELTQSKFDKAAEIIATFNESLEGEVREAAQGAALTGDWKAWKKLVVATLEGSPEKLSSPLDVTLEQHPDGLLAMMKPDWSWSTK